jgi:hypothetical protein
MRSNRLDNGIGVFIKICFLLIFIIQNIGANDNWPTLKGPYLGQKPPGMIPEIFAPDIISTAEHEGSSGFSFTPVQGGVTGISIGWMQKLLKN